MPAPHYQTFDNLRRIWSPEDFRKLQEHAAKFEGLPATEPVIGAQYPTHDGDMAELEELADKVIAAYGELPEITHGFCVDELMERVVELHAVAPVFLSALAYRSNPQVFAAWPVDAVPAMLAEWPKRIVDEEVSA